MDSISEFQDFVLDNLSSSKPLSIRTLIPKLKAINPSAHPNIQDSEYSEAGMEYVILRLPKEILDTRDVVLTADPEFIKSFEKNSDFESICCHKRKRAYFYSSKEKKLVVGINSVSDINDIIPIMTSLLIEASKLSKLVTKSSGKPVLSEEYFNTNHSEFLKDFWGDEYEENIEKLSGIKDIKLIAKNIGDKYFRKRAQLWGDKYQQFIDEQGLRNAPVYIVMGNSHSIVNPLSTYVRDNKDKLLDWAHSKGVFDELLEKADRNQEWMDDCLYYLQRKYLQENPDEMVEAGNSERNQGFLRCKDEDYDGPDFTLIKLSKQTSKNNDSRIFDKALDSLKDHKAFILNFDFTMGGYQAKYVLSEILERTGHLVRGVYILGKAGSLEGKIGDIIIPTMTYDCYTKNIYFYKNDLKSKYARRYLRKGDILEEHGMLTVWGVLLQNRDMLDYYFGQNLTGIEMEGGPYLTSILEHILRISNENHDYKDEFVQLMDIPFDFGIIYYVSDTPYHEGKTLGTLGTKGLEAVYAVSVSIINRILIKEVSVKV